MREFQVRFDPVILHALLVKSGIDVRKVRISELKKLKAKGFRVPGTRSIENAISSGFCSENIFAGLAQLFLAFEAVKTAQDFRSVMNYRPGRFGSWEFDDLKRAAREKDVVQLTRIAGWLSADLPCEQELILEDADLPQILSLGYYEDVRDGRGRAHLAVLKYFVEQFSKEETHPNYARLTRTMGEIAYRYRDLASLRDSVERVVALTRVSVKSKFISPELHAELLHFIADYGNIFDFGVCQQLVETAREHPDRINLGNMVIKSFHCSACTQLRAGKPEEARLSLDLAKNTLNQFTREHKLSPQQIHLRRGYIRVLEASLPVDPKTQRRYAMEAAKEFELAKAEGFDHLMAKGYAFALISDAEEDLGEPLASMSAAYAALYQFRECPYRFSCLFDYSQVLERLTLRLGAMRL
jgi:hypothetical protein